jgi:hypothetical protein
MNEKNKKTALTVTTIVSSLCLVLALVLGVLSRTININSIFYYILAYIALVAMLTDSCIRKKGMARFLMVLIYGVGIIAVTVLVIFVR